MLWFLFIFYLKEIYWLSTSVHIPILTLTLFRPSRGLLCDCEMSAPAPRQQINSQSVCPVSSFTRTPARARVAAVPSSADTARSSCVRAYRGPTPPAAGRPSQVTAPRHRLREITLINTILNMRKCIFRLFNFRKKILKDIFGITLYFGKINI